MSNKIIGKQDEAYKQYILNKIEEFNTNGKKTIVHFCDTYYPIIDGVVKVVENYAKTMCKKFNVVLVVPKHKGMTVTEKTDFLVIGAKGHFFKFLNYDLGFPKYDGFLRKVFKLLRVDLIHGHSPFTMGSFASKKAKKLKVPYLMTLHSQYKQDFMRYTKSKFLTAILLKGIMRVFKRSDEVWTMHDVTRRIVKEYGYKGSVYLMPNATDFHPTSDPATLSAIADQKFGFNDELPVFLFVGRLVEQKNLKFIVSALKIVKEKGVKFKMLFVGDGPDKKMLLNHIDACGLNEDVLLAGKIEDIEILSACYAKATLFLFPSVYDTSSLVQIEASSLYTPSVLLKDTATAQTVTHGKNGYVCDRTPEAFAEQIVSALSNKEELKQISVNAHNDLYITWEKLGERIEERYNYLIENVKK